MGRKLKGAALRAYRRGRANAAEIVEDNALKAESQTVVNKADEELFVIDTTGDSKAQVPPQLKQVATKKQQKQQANKSALPALDQQKVEALVQKHNAQKLQVMVQEGHAKMTGDRRRVSQRAQRNNGNYNLWGAEDDGVADTTTTAAKASSGKGKKGKHKQKQNNKVVSSKQHIKDANAEADKLLRIGGIKGEHKSLVAEQISRVAAKGTTVAVDVARAGQSYRPDPHQYTTLVQDAVSVELRRQKAQAFNKAPLATGMSEETRALLVGDSDSESSDEEDDVDDDDTNLALQKRPGKMTRAERNKQKRLRSEKVLQDELRQRKKLENSIGEIPRFKKEIKKHKQELQQKKDELEEKKEQNKETPGKDVLQRYSKKDPIHAPTLPVALASEHQDSSLRTIKPKGSLITDRMASLADRNLVSKRKMGDKKRIMQGKRRKLNVKGKGFEIAREMDHKMMG